MLFVQGFEGINRVGKSRPFDFDSGKLKSRVSSDGKAHHLEAVFEATGSRGGFMLGHPVAMPGDLTAIVDLLVPELQRRGRFRTAYGGGTLRDTLMDVYD